MYMYAYIIIHHIISIIMYIFQRIGVLDLRLQEDNRLQTNTHKRRIRYFHDCLRKHQ